MEQREPACTWNIFLFHILEGLRRAFVWIFWGGTCNLRHRIRIAGVCRLWIHVKWVFGRAKCGGQKSGLAVVGGCSMIWPRIRLRASALMWTPPARRDGWWVSVGWFSHVCWTLGQSLEWETNCGFWDKNIDMFITCYYPLQNYNSNIENQWTIET